MTDPDRGKDSPVINFLADESCDFAVVRALRREKFDVVAVAEQARGATDDRVVELARGESRILLTEDRDFGRLVFAAARLTSGVVFIRFPADRRAERFGPTSNTSLNAESDMNLNERIRCRAIFTKHSRD